MFILLWNLSEIKYYFNTSTRISFNNNFFNFFWENISCFIMIHPGILKLIKSNCRKFFANFLIFFDKILAMLHTLVSRKVLWFFMISSDLNSKRNQKISFRNFISNILYLQHLQFVFWYSFSSGILRQVEAEYFSLKYMYSDSLER